MAADRPPARTDRMLDQEAFQNAADAAGIQLKVFLAGPYIDTNGPEPGNGVEFKAKRLRYALYHRLCDVELVVTLGEYPKLIDAAKSLTGTWNNAANAEFNHVKKSANAVVIIMDGPGAFLELGAFCINEEICRKMLIMIDSKYKNDDINYLNAGPIPAAKKKGAKVRFIEYDDRDACWSLVEEHISEQYGRMADRLIYMP